MKVPSDAPASETSSRKPARPAWLPRPVIARFFSLLVAVAALVSLLAVLSYHPSDVSLLSADSRAARPILNISGVLGAWLAFVMRGGFGYAGLLLPLILAVLAIQLWHEWPSRAHWVVRLIASAAVFAGVGTLAALSYADDTSQVEAGGVIGFLLAGAGRYYLGAVGTGLLAGAVAVFAGVLVVDRPVFPDLGGWIAALGRWRLGRRQRDPSDEPVVKSARRQKTSETADPVIAPTVGLSESEAISVQHSEPRPRAGAISKPKPVQSPPVKLRQAPGGFQLPSVDLLTTPPPAGQRQLTEDLQVNARILVETLREFGIEATCVNIDRGPAVTRYELAPAPGVKLTKIVSLADDLALVLKAGSCHIVAPIPGKGLVGIEVPNSTATMVYLKEILTSRPFQQVTSPLALAIGKDVSGSPVICDLRECPHLLVAGATGSGKTVFLNSLLTGLLYHASPDQVKFLMIDPKMVELVLFNEIPHLVAPVVTDAKKASAALNWAVQEMERRYRRLAELGARNIESYNQKAPETPDERGHGKLSYLVVVIDELADLMMVSSQDVEESITRLSQMSRAVGIHIILATQRPSVDVITGVIKANFPARIAFQVATKVDSRTILDVNGADKLLGHGDMLFLRPGTAKPIRAQGAFLTEGEIERVVAYLKTQRQPIYDEQLINQPDPNSVDPGTIIEKDELYEMAKKLVLETGQASTSLLQRRLRLGYGRAARILDLMEQEGVVGPPQGSRPREVLVGQHAGEHRG